MNYAIYRIENNKKLGLCIDHARKTYTWKENFNSLFDYNSAQAIWIILHAQYPKHLHIEIIKELTLSDGLT